MLGVFGVLLRILASTSTRPPPPLSGPGAPPARAAPAPSVLSRSPASRRTTISTPAPATCTYRHKTFASNSSFIETTDADSVNLVDTSGELLGVVEIAKAVDASGALSEVRLSSSDSEISLQNSDSADTVDLVFIPAKDLGQDSTVNYEDVIGVPGNYLFDPNHPQKRLHDYCSNSPDEFPNPIGPNAPFHGPCAIHDMCIEAAGHHDHACDGPLRDNMKNNCRATYGPGATRGSCEATADVYYGAVTAASYFD